MTYRKTSRGCGLGIFALAALCGAGCGSSAGGPATEGSGGMTASGGATTGGSSGGAGASGSGGASSGSGGQSTGAAGSAGRGSPGGRTGGAGVNGSAGRGVAGGGGSAKPGGASGAAPEPFKGVANSPCAARKALNVSWYYDWTQTESEPCSDGAGGVFVPMIWGHAGNEQSGTGIASSVSAFVGKHQPFVLGFNEPDNATQSNIPVATAINLWPSFLNASIQVVSPATQANTAGQSWFSSFMTQANAGNLRVDIVGLHWYGWNAGSCEPTAATLESYIKWAEGITGTRPIWLTEWGCLNNSAPDAQTVVTFFKAAVAMFAKHPRIRRYAWYPWSTNLALVNTDGSLTDLGKAFAALPATH